jgi:hypothetical protein
MAGSISGIDWVSRMPVSGTHTVTSGQASANKAEINTGKVDAVAAIVQIIVSGKVATSDAAVAVASGVLTVGDGSTYNMAQNDVINWIVF